MTLPTPTAAGLPYTSVNVAERNMINIQISINLHCGVKNSFIDGKRVGRGSFLPDSLQ